MTIRLPLSAKILIWFFLNLTILAAVFVLLFKAQFQFDLDWIFSSSAGQRVEAVRELIVGELNSRAPDEWGSVLERFGEAYNIHFSLFEPNGELLLGTAGELPPQVRDRLLRSGAPPRAFLRTDRPARYWLLLHAELDNFQVGGPMRLTLVGEARSLSMGGLVIDPWPWLCLAAGAAAFSVLFWLPLLRGITRCIRQMTQTTRQIADGRFEVRVEARRGDELGSLSESINQMAARLNGFVEGQKRFLGDIAHELCSPLARLQMTLGIMEQRAGPEQIGPARSALAKAAQIGELVNELLAFSRASFGARAVELQPLDVRQCAQAAAEREGAEARIDIAGPLEILADETLLVRALGNLIRNAVRHGGPGVPVTISAVREGDRVLIRVADSGPGVPEEELPKLFDAFYRIDRARTRETGGVGLGLTIVKTCVESCGGGVTARNRAPRGLEVTLDLPAAQ